MAKGPEKSQSASAAAALPLKRKSKKAMAAATAGLEEATEGVKPPEPNPRKKRTRSATEGVKPPESKPRKKRTRSATVSMAQEAEEAESDGVEAPAPMGRRKKTKSATVGVPRGRDGDGVQAAAAPPPTNYIIVHSASEFLQRTSKFAPGSVLVAIGKNASLYDASVFWQFLSARQISNGPGFRLQNVQTLVHKSSALKYVHAQINELTQWHNSLGLHLQTLESQIQKIDSSIEEGASSSVSNSYRWPLDAVNFILESKPEAVEAAAICAAEMKKSICLDPSKIEACKREKHLPLLGNTLSSTSSVFPHQNQLVKEPSPNPMAQKEMRVFVKRSKQIQKDALQSLQQNLFDGILELRREMEGATFLGCGATDYAEFCDD